MFEFFDAISNVFDYFIGIAGDMVDLFGLGFRAAEYLLGVIYYAPTFFKTALLPFISLFVILLLLNRGA